MFTRLRISGMLVLFCLFALNASAQATPVEIHFLFYCDRLECDVMRDLLDRFEEANPDIVVDMEVVPYNTIRSELVQIIESGEAPDIARVTGLAIYRGNYLDLRPYLDEETATFWDENFPEAALSVMRDDPESNALHGFPDSLTVSAPFVNRTMFDGAGIALPSEVLDEPTWEDWTTAAAEVAEFWSSEETPVWAIAMDRSGHRFAGPALSMGATFFDEDGNLTVDSEGFRAAAEMLYGWHEDGLSPDNVWLDAGTGYAQAADIFAAGQLVMYMSGSWQLGRFADDASINFTWEVVPNPSGEGGSTGMPGGANIVAFNQTEHPEEVARVMTYLIDTDIYMEYSALTLQLPAQAEVVRQGVPYQTPNPQLFDGLMAFNAEVVNLDEAAYALQFHPYAFAYTDNAANRLTQYITGELTLDEMLEQFQSDIDAAIAEAGA
jgi:alpha-1,4-digalacturonate transport system substrate-binding protein